MNKPVGVPSGWEEMCALIWATKFRDKRFAAIVRANAPIMSDVFMHEDCAYDWRVLE